MYRRILSLAFKDWLHEWSLSLCAVFALIGILTPVLMLLSIQNGIIEASRQRLLSDPDVLIVIPKGSSGAGFSEEFLETVGAYPETGFSIGRIRNVASELQMEGQSGSFRSVPIEATGEGDPLRSGHKNASALSSPFAVILSEPAASQLKASEGSELKAKLSRITPEGKREAKTLSLTVGAVLPKEAAPRELALVSLPLLLAVQDYRDNVASSLLGTEGLEPPEKRFFEGFRLYARSIDDVEKLEKRFASQGIPVQTKAKEIRNLNRLNSALNFITLTIGSVGLLGYCAFIVSSALGSVQRKSRDFGLLYLLGFSRLPLKLFPLAQALLTAASGCLLSGILYFGLACAVNFVFARIGGAESLCVLPLSEFAGLIAGVLALTAASAFFAAQKASKTAPSNLLRNL